MNPELENLINMALADGEVTDKERAIILRKAETLGEEKDEVEMILDGKIALLKKEQESNSKSSNPKTPLKAKTATQQPALKAKPKIKDGDLKISGRGIEILEDVINWFSDDQLGEIECLDLSNNKISDLSLLNKFEGLKEICLKNNLIEILPLDFNKDGNYTDIDLSNNQIENIDIIGSVEPFWEMGGYNDSFISLTISNNNIKSFQNLPYTSYLHLDNNKIDFFDNTMVSCLKRKLPRNIYLAGNPIKDFSFFKEIINDLNDFKLHPYVVNLLKEYKENNQFLGENLSKPRRRLSDTEKHKVKFHKIQHKGEMLMWDKDMRSYLEDEKHKEKIILIKEQLIEFIISRNSIITDINLELIGFKKIENVGEGEYEFHLTTITEDDICKELLDGLQIEQQAPQKKKGFWDIF